MVPNGTFMLRNPIGDCLRRSAATGTPAVARNLSVAAPHSAAISAGRRAVDAIPSGHSGLAGILSDLTAALRLSRPARLSNLGTR